MTELTDLCILMTMKKKCHSGKSFNQNVIQKKIKFHWRSTHWNGGKKKKRTLNEVFKCYMWIAPKYNVQYWRVDKYLASWSCYWHFLLMLLLYFFYKCFQYHSNSDQSTSIISMKLRLIRKYIYQITKLVHDFYGIVGLFQCCII